jgi:hypothetical protein
MAATACGQTIAGVKADGAAPVTVGRTRTTENNGTSPRRVPTSESQSGNTTPPAAPTDTPQLPPDSVPSIEKQADAQALIDNVPNLVGDPSSTRRSTRVDATLQAELQKIADGKAGGDKQFFNNVESPAVPGEAVNPYLVCPIADGDACAASPEDFNDYMKKCDAPSTQWTAMLVPGADGWAAAAVCIWKPSDAERTAAIDVVAQTVAAESKANGHALTRDTGLDALAEQWAQVYLAHGDPSKLPGFTDLHFWATEDEFVGLPGEIGNGELADQASGSSLSQLSDTANHVGLATVISPAGLIVLIVAAAS